MTEAIHQMVIYLLHHRKKNQFYVGQAEKLVKRVKKGSIGVRKGLDDDWDKFMFFQLEPEKWNEHIDELEDWTIRLFAPILPSDIAKLKLKPVNVNKLYLVKKASLRKK